MEEWRALKPRWDAMLAGSRSDAVFLCWDWLDVWLDVYGGGVWFILIAEDEAGGLLGAAPMMIARSATSAGGWLRVLTLLGQQADTASEYLDWIALRECEEEVTGAFARCLFGELRADWDVMELAFVREDAAILPALRAAFEHTGVTPAIEFQTNSPFLPLPAAWEEFAASRSGSFRNKLGKFHRDHKTAFREPGVDMTVPEAMALIRELHGRRWSGRSSSFTSADYIRFHDQIAGRFHAQGRLLLLLLQIDGQTVAGRYDFAYGGKGWNFQGGWLPEWERRSVGKMMITEVIRRCIALGLREYDFLGGDAGYKSDWTEARRVMVTVEAPNPRSLRGRLFVRLRAMVRALRRLKSGRPLPAGPSKAAP